MGRLDVFKAFLSLSIFFLGTAASLTAARATDLPLRGIARGEARIKVGEKAPLLLKEMKDANREGKVIVLMLGYQSHCPWCDRMERYIEVMMRETGNFNNKAVFIQRQSEHAKLIPPHPEGVMLKEAYGVQGQPWLFIIDGDGLVRFIYKVFVSSEDFKKNMDGLLKK